MDLTIFIAKPFLIKIFLKGLLVSFLTSAYGEYMKLLVRR
jgi:hypothetical protein